MAENSSAPASSWSPMMASVTVCPRSAPHGRSARIVGGPANAGPQTAHAKAALSIEYRFIQIAPYRALWVCRDLCLYRYRREAANEIAGRHIINSHQAVEAASSDLRAAGMECHREDAAAMPGELGEQLAVLELI